MKLSKPKKGYKWEKTIYQQYQQIPIDWDFVSIANIGKVVGGGTPNTNKTEYWENGNISWFTPEEITKLTHNFVKNSKRKITQKGLDESSAKIIPENNILITTRASIGHAVINEIDVSTNQGFQNLIINKNHNNKFLMYSIKFNKNRMLQYAQGTTFLEISKTNFEKIKILCPKNIDEEEKIGKILSNIDNLIEKQLEVIDKIQKLRTNQIQKLFTQGIGHTEFKKVPWLFGKNIEIPTDWKIKKIDEIFDFLTSGTNSRDDLTNDGEIYYIHYGDVHTKWDRQLNCDVEKIPKINKKKVSKIPLLKEGDLIIADASEDVEGSGTSIVLKNLKNKKIVAGLHTIALRRKSKNISFNFIQYLTLIPSVKIQITSWVTGAKVLGLSKKNCKKINVPLPTSFDEQEKIASKLLNLDLLIKQEKQYKEKLENLKKGLMQQLLTGEKRVKV